MCAKDLSERQGLTGTAHLHSNASFAPTITIVLISGFLGLNGQSLGKKGLNTLAVGCGRNNIKEEWFAALTDSKRSQLITESHFENVHILDPANTMTDTCVFQLTS